MSTESQRICQEKEFSLQSNIRKLDVSTFASECEDMRRTLSFMAYNGIQRNGTPKLNGKLSQDDLESLYICKIDESKLNGGRRICSEEQPLDFSKKSNGAVQANGLSPRTAEMPHPKNNATQINGLPQNAPDDYNNFPKNNATHVNGISQNMADDSHRIQRNSISNSDCSDNSADEIEGKRSFTNYLDARALKRRMMPEVPIPWSNGRVSLKDEFESKRMRTDTSSESEDESNSVNGNNFRQADFHFQLESSRAEPRPAEGTKFHHSPYKINETPHTPNGHSENGADSLTGKNERFLIQDILSQQSTRNAESSLTSHGMNDSPHQPRTSPQSSSREEIISSRLTSPSQSTPLPTSGYPVGVNDISHATNRMFTPYVQTVFPPSSFTNFVNQTSSDIPGYSRLYSYPPGSMLQPPFNPMYALPYQQALQAGQNKQRPKEQRPFKSIDPSAILSHLPISKSAEVLEEIGLSLGNGSSVATVASSSPQRLSPDSPCIANSSLITSSEIIPQDTNGDTDRKTIRRIPPEEKDEKYLEKRRKNNLAAKKSRDERRKKEDLLAASVKALASEIATLNAANEFLKNNLRDKEMRLDVIKGQLITFREKCDVRTRELFEDTFRIFLPMQ